MRHPLMYGTALSKNVEKAKKIDTKVLQQYFKSLIFTDRVIIKKLFEKMYIRLRTP